MTMTGAPKTRRGRPPRTAAQRAEQRATLVSGAIAAIRAGGPDLSMDELAAGIGVSKPVIYDEFGGRSGVADAIATVLAEQLEAEVWETVGRSATMDPQAVVDAMIGAIMTLVEDEPDIYRFIVRAIRDQDRGLLDNALVRELHGRTSVLLRALAPDLNADVVAVLIDGVYGFVLAAVESWQATSRLSREQMATTLGRLIREGLAAVVAADG